MKQKIIYDKASLIYSKEIINQFAKSFSFASKLLPKNKRQATYAMYAYCRYADNIIDKERFRTRDELELEIAGLRNELTISYRTGESEHPIIKNFIKAASGYNIPIEYPNDLLDGVLMDKSIFRYQTFDELYVFCYRVASVVGLMMTHILGFEDKKALIYAEKLGVAMQLTNILRDIKEDKEMGRIYIPLDELGMFNLNESHIINEIFNEDFKAMMKFQVDRAKSYYKEAEMGIKMLDKNSQFAIYSASRIYGGILSKIEANDYNPFKGRVFVPKRTKFSILVNELIKQKLRLQAAD